MLLGRAEANIKVAMSLFKAATRDHNPNVQAAMFWLKNCAGWKDPGLITVDADGVGTLSIEFVGADALAQAVRATAQPDDRPHGGNGAAHPSPGPRPSRGSMGSVPRGGRTRA